MRTLLNSWQQRKLAWLPVVAICAVAFLGSTPSPASRLVLGWDPNPTNDRVTAYLVTAKTNGLGAEHVWTNVWVKDLVSFTNVVPQVTAEYEVGDTNALGVTYKTYIPGSFAVTNYLTNIYQRLPHCAVISNLPPEHVYWLTVRASNAFGLSDESLHVLQFSHTNEESVIYSRTFSSTGIHMSVFVDPGWHYFLKSSHGTPAGAFDPCCGNFVTNYSEVHWNRLAEDDYLGFIPTNVSKITFTLQPGKLKHQLYRVFRARASSVLTNATRNPTIQYHE
jgi:hypothetical protein